MNVAEIRKERGMTQKQLADKTGTSVRWVQKLEKGEIDIQNISFLNGIRLLLALNEGETDEVMKDFDGCIRSTYCMMKGILNDGN